MITKPTKFKKELEKSLNSLYYLEDLNDFKNDSIGKKINKCIEILNSIED